jgi:hypothetical protein
MMVRNLFLLCAPVIVFSLTMAAPAQEKTHKNANEGRWEGNVVRSNPEKSTLTVRRVDSNVEKTVHYDGGTRWVSQEHGSKKFNDIDPTQVKDNDRVIARGIWDKGVLYATLISKRLSHSKRIPKGPGLIGIPGNFFPLFEAPHIKGATPLCEHTGRVCHTQLNRGPFLDPGT